MIEDAFTVVWKDVKEITRGGLRGGTTRMLLYLAIFGVMLPMQMRAMWFEWPSVLMLSWTALLLVSTVIADSFAGERERHTLETLLASRLSEGAILMGKLAAAVGYAWALVLACMVIGVVTVNATGGTGHSGLVLPGAGVVLGSVVLPFLSALFAATYGVLISLRATSVKSAAQAITLPLMLLPLSGMLGLRYLPPATRARLGAAIASMGSGTLLLYAGLGLLVVDVALLALARARFRRESLIAP